MTRLPHAVLFGTTVGLIGIAVFAPDLFHGLMQEDAWCEWATFVAFAAAALLALFGLIGSRASMDRFAFTALLLFAIFVAGEEISWGQRILAFEPPEIFLEKNYQQELNVHNLLKTVLDTRWMVVIIAVGYGVVLPFLVRLRPLQRFERLAPRLVLLPWFSAVAVLEVAYPFDLTGELAEMLLGLVFVFDLGLRLPALPAWTAFATQLAAMVMALALAPLAEAVVFGDQAANVATVRGELELMRSDLLFEGAQTKKLFKKRKVHKRLYTAIRAGYVRFGPKSKFLEAQADRKDRKGYFLDVWNQPYWILHRRKGDVRTLLLYSFGPNRRRDGAPGKSDGDDISIEVQVGTSEEEGHRSHEEESQPLPEGRIP